MAEFEQAYQENHIQLLVLPPRSPKLNGCVERAHRMHVEEATSRIKTVARELHPQNLLTWPADGLSGQDDQKTVSRWTSFVFEEMATDTKAPSALYHLILPQSVATEQNMGELHAIPDEKVSLTVDVMPVWKQKRIAIHCHRTQTSGSPILTATEEKQHLFFGKEHFRWVGTRERNDFLRAYEVNNRR